MRLDELDVEDELDCDADDVVEDADEALAAEVLADADTEAEVDEDDAASTRHGCSATNTAMRAITTAAEQAMISPRFCPAAGAGAGAGAGARPPVTGGTAADGRVGAGSGAGCTTGIFAVVPVPAAPGDAEASSAGTGVPHWVQNLSPSSNGRPQLRQNLWLMLSPLTLILHVFSLIILA